MNKDDDEKLWAHIAKGIKPLDKPDVYNDHVQKKSSSLVKKTKPKKRSSIDTQPSAIPPVADKVHVKSKSLDRRTEQKLRRGQIPIDRTIDLHGLNQAEAHRLLNKTLLEAYGQNKRLVLVVTGKGLRSAEPGGVLRRRVREWCDISPLSDVVLKVTHARPHHGGEGAYYIYLRR